MIGLLDPAFVARLTPPAGGGLSPVAGMALWLKASSLSLADGDPVATWPDLSGNGNDATQATSGSRPTFRSAILNGKAIVRFDGSNDSMISGSVAHGTVIIVVKFSGDGVALGNDVGDNNYSFFRLGGTLYTFVGGTLTGTAPSAGFHVLSHLSGSAGLQLVDGAVNASGVLGLSTGAALIGRRHNVGDDWPLPGDIAEVLIYPTALSAPDREAVEAYLAAEYAL